MSASGYNSLSADAEPGAATAGGRLVGDDATDAKALQVSKSTMVDILQRRRHRADQCRSVPVSTAMYIFYIVCMMTHVAITPGYDFESNLLNNIVNAGDGFAPAAVGDWYAWMQETFIPYVLPDTDANGNTLPPEQRGYFAQFGLIVGGVRLVQTRGVETNCSGLAPALQSVYGKQCHDMGVYSDATYGDAETAEALGVLSAFQPASPQTSDGHLPSGAAEFEFYLNVENDTSVNVDLVTALATAGWIDASTRDVRVQLAVLNGEVGMWGRVEFVAEFTRGSRVATSTRAISVWVDPYAGRGYLYVLDVIMILYWVYLTIGTLRRLWGVLSNGSHKWWTRVAMLFAYNRVLDMMTTGFLLAVIVAWGVCATRLAAIRASLADVASPSPTAFAGGPTDLQNRINEATFSFYAFKNCAAVTLALLTLRMYKYFAFQPRLAVMTATFEKAFSDAVHFAFLFGLLLVMYGVWGHFQFGTQAAMWADPSMIATTVMRFAMYDYDLEAMEAQYRLLADIFYVTFMFTITNLVLWMFLAILLENYTEIRYESHLGPSAWQEAGAYLATLPQTFGVVRWLRGRRITSYGSGNKCFGSGVSSTFSTSATGGKAATSATPLLGGRTATAGAAGASTVTVGAASARGAAGISGVPAASPITLAELTWAEILDCVAHHPLLKNKDEITAEDISHAIGLSAEEAQLLVVDMTTAGRIVAGKLKPTDTDLTAGVLYGALSPKQLAAVSSAADESVTDGAAVDATGVATAAVAPIAAATAARDAAVIAQLTSVVAQLSAQVASLRDTVAASNAAAAAAGAAHTTTTTTA